MTHPQLGKSESGLECTCRVNHEGEPVLDPGCPYHDDLTVLGGVTHESLTPFKDAASLARMWDRP